MPPQSRGQQRRPGNRSLSDPNSNSTGSSKYALKNHGASDHAPAVQLVVEQDEDDEAPSGSSLEGEVLSHPSEEDGEDDDVADSPDSPPPAQNLPVESLRPRLTPRSNSYGPAAFAPPFYNRPPTPLPPSPSLTSLLRPLPFGAPLSRTTTPESSDTEATGSLAAGLDPTAAAVAQSARVATTVPRASPKVPTYEYYGFVLYLGSSLAFLMYLLWSYLPTPFLHQLGIYYYPNRWWSLAIPAWIVVAIFYVYVALAAWNTGVMTLPLSSLECFVDEKARVAVVDAKGKIIRDTGRGKRAGKGKGRVESGASLWRMGTAGQKLAGYQDNDMTSSDLNWREVWSEGTDAVMDVPLSGVCEILYGSGRDQDTEEAGD